MRCSFALMRSAEDVGGCPLYLICSAAIVVSIGVQVPCLACSGGRGNFNYVELAETWESIAMCSWLSPQSFRFFKVCAAQIVSPRLFLASFTPVETPFAHFHRMITRCGSIPVVKSTSNYNSNTKRCISFVYC